MNDFLNSLEARAGASDNDREAWLAERLAGITATELRDIMKKGASTRSGILEAKRTKKSKQLAMNKYLAWGQKREPIIADYIERRYGIRPESRVFHAVNNSRFLASPDGVGVVAGVGVVSEIKTSKHFIAPDSKEFATAGYIFQMQWAMYVTGAEKCLYVVENHDDNWKDRGGDFDEPALFEFDGLPAVAVFWIERDENIINQLVEVASNFLSELDGVFITESWSDVIFGKQKEVISLENRVKVLKKEISEEVEGRAMGEPLTVQTSYGKISRGQDSLVKKFQASKFKTAHADLYQEFSEETVVKGRLTITLAKGEK